MRTLPCFILCCLATAAGCTSASFETIEPISQQDIYKVVGEVKRQISVYTAYQNSEEGYPRVLARSRSKFCGNGLIGFDIVSVRMELVAESDSTVGGGVGIGATPISASLGGSRSVSNSQVLSILNEIVPSAERQPYNPGDLDTAPLARAMRNLWETALSSGDDRSDICLKLKKGSDDNTYQMGITVVKGLNGEIGVGLSNVALSASGKFTSTTGNTVTVKFEPHDFAALQRKREACRKGDPKCGSQYHMAPPQLDCAPADTRCQNVYQRQYLQQ